MSRWFALGVGVIVGILVAGLAAPFLVADRATTQVVAAAAPASPGISDPGVEAKTINVGFSSPALASLQNFGFGYLNSGDVEGRYRALVDDLNAKGGINGRTITPSFAQYDLGTDPAAASQAACTSLATDHHAFAVLDAGPYPSSGLGCYADQHIPFLTLNGYAESAYQPGTLFTAFPSYERSLRQQVAYLNGRHLLDGKTIGVLTDVGSQRTAVTNALVPALAAVGQKVVDVEAANEDATALQQLPSVLSNFKAHHVDLLIMAAFPLFGQLFPDLAAAQGFQPAYAYSDFYNDITDVYGNFGKAADGAVGITATRVGEDRAGQPIPASDQACLDRVGTKETLKRGTEPYIIAMYQCAMFDLFVQAATKAGPTLTHAGFVQAAETLGTFAVPNSSDGSIGPGKHDLLDGVRTVTYDSSCPCWKSSGEPFAVPK